MSEQATDIGHHRLEAVVDTDRTPLAGDAERGRGATVRIGPFTPDWRQAVGAVLVAFGLVALVLGWYGLSGTVHPWEQLSFLASGGLGGAALIGTGMVLFVSYEHARDRQALDRVLERLQALEAEVRAGRSDEIVAKLAALEDLVRSDGRAPRGTGRARGRGQ